MANCRGSYTLTKLTTLSITCRSRTPQHVAHPGVQLRLHLKITFASTGFVFAKYLTQAKLLPLGLSP